MWQELQTHSLIKGHKSVKNIPTKSPKPHLYIHMILRQSAVSKMCEELRTRESRRMDKMTDRHADVRVFSVVLLGAIKSQKKIRRSLGANKTI